MDASIDQVVVSPLRSCGMTWAASALLPLPVLVASGEPAAAAGVACLYLSLASAWLAVEVMRCGGWPPSRAQWHRKLLALSAGVAANTALFVGMGMAAGVRTNIPFPVMAALAATPAVGLVPWLALRLRSPFGAVLAAAVLLLAAKLAACVAARVAYGPGFLEAGYVAGDWNTAKLMISLFWGQVVMLSAGGVVMGYRSFTMNGGEG